MILMMKTVIYEPHYQSTVGKDSIDHRVFKPQAAEIHILAIRAKILMVDPGTSASTVTQRQG